MTMMAGREVGGGRGEASEERGGKRIFCQ